MGNLDATETELSNAKLIYTKYHAPAPRWHIHTNTVVT